MKKTLKYICCLLTLALLLSGCGGTGASRPSSDAAIDASTVRIPQEQAANTAMTGESAATQPAGFSHLDEVWLSRVFFDGYPIFFPEINREITAEQLGSAVSGDDAVTAKVLKYTLVDLDSDGSSDAVLRLEVNGNEAGGFVALKKYGDTLHGYYLWYRAFSPLKEDGTFLSSGGAGDNSIERLSFSEEGGYSVHTLANRAGTSFYIGGEAVSETAYQEYFAEFEEKPEVFWRDYSRLAGTSCTVSREDGGRETYRYTLAEDDTVAIIGYSGPGGDVVIPSTLDGKAVSAIGRGDLSIGAFQGRKGITSVVIPEGVGVIYDNAFYDCADLTSATIPASTALIWHCAFSGCHELKAVYFEGEPPLIAQYVFSSSPTLYYRALAQGWSDTYYGCKTVAMPPTGSFTLRDTLLNGVSLWTANYSQTRELLGEPMSTAIYEVSSAADVDSFLLIAEYPELDIEFLLPSAEPTAEKLAEAGVLRFDITGPAYPLKGVSVGMTETQLRTACFGQMLYNLSDLDNVVVRRNGLAETQAYQLTSAKKLLTDYKPDGRYAGYDGFVYWSGGVQDDELADYPEWRTTALGAVILLKDGRVARIVFGFPTAG